MSASSSRILIYFEFGLLVWDGRGGGADMIDIPLQSLFWVPSRQTLRFGTANAKSYGFFFVFFERFRRRRSPRTRLLRRRSHRRRSHRTRLRRRRSHRRRSHRTRHSVLRLGKPAG